MPAGSLRPSIRTQIQDFLRTAKWPKRPRKKRPARASFASRSSKSMRGRGLIAGPNPFPLIWKGAKQGYSDTANYSVGAAGVFGAETTFTLNDQFDPRFSIGGHQPYGRDTFATLYERYKVTGATIEVTFTKPTTDGIACAVLFSNPTNTQALVGSSYDRIKEMPQSEVRVLNDSGSQIVKIKRYIPMYHAAGCTKLQYDADVGIYDALAGNSPATAGMCYMRVAVADIGGGGTGTCTVAVRITMHTQWYQRKMLTQS